MPLSATECLPLQVAEARAEAEAARAEALGSVAGYRAPLPPAPAAPASDAGGAPAQPLTLAALRARWVFLTGLVDDRYDGAKRLLAALGAVLDEPVTLDTGVPFRRYTFGRH